MRKFLPLFVIALLYACAGEPVVGLKDTPEVDTKQAEALPDLWLYAVGVNRYENLNSRANLRYAVLNIRGIVNSFKPQEGKVYGKVHQLIITDSGDAMPSYNGIIYNPGFPGQAKPDDVLLFFYSGHGEINDDGIQATRCSKYHGKLLKANKGRPNMILK